MGSIHSTHVVVYSSMSQDNQGMNHEVLLAHLRYLAAQLDRHAQALTLHGDPLDRERIAADLRAIAADLRALAPAPPPPGGL